MTACVRYSSPNAVPFGGCSLPYTQAECEGLAVRAFILSDPTYRACYEDWVYSGAITDEPSNNVYKADFDCGDIGDEETRPLLGACCYRTTGQVGETFACFHTTQEVCQRGYSVAGSYLASPGHGCPIFTELVRVRVNFEGDLLTDAHITPGDFKGAGVACRCILSVEPYVPEEWADNGVTHCMQRINDNRTIEQICNGFAACCQGDVCSMEREADCRATNGEFHPGRSCFVDNPCLPDDEFSCKLRGLQVTIDDDGHARFIGEPARISAINECNRMMADLYVDGEGVARIAGKVGLGDLGHSECTAGYMETEWDTVYDCG